jgi:Tfp pilus assembly protein PilF
MTREDELAERLNADFYDPEALFLLGKLYMDQGKNGLGAVLTSAAIDASPHFLEAKINLGAAYKAEHKNDIALSVWKDALRCEMAPNRRAQVMVNIAGLFLTNGTPDQAVRWCEKALEEDPNCWRAYADRGFAFLEQGRWEDGWEGLYLAHSKAGKRDCALPEWNGAAGQKVFVYGGQGIGDEIFFASCLNDMASLSDKIVFECHPRLTELFKRSFPDVEVHGRTAGVREWLLESDVDCSIGLAQLPWHFRKSDDDWTGEPYLKNHPGCHGAPRGGPTKIGIAWSGGTKKTNQAARSVSLEALTPIIDTWREVEWHSLQYTADAAREVCEFHERTGLRIEHEPGWVECEDYDRTASFVATLDLVITVCTSVHDLAGALGVPCWTLVPRQASWRHAHNSYPWYGCAKPYRQDEAETTWTGVIESIAQDLRGV